MGRLPKERSGKEKLGGGQLHRRDKREAAAHQVAQEAAAMACTLETGNSAVTIALPASCGLAARQAAGSEERKPSCRPETGRRQAAQAAQRATEARELTAGTRSCAGPCVSCYVVTCSWGGILLAALPLHSGNKSTLYGRFWAATHAWGIRQARQLFYIR